MNQTLIFCYLVFFVTVLSPFVPSGYPELDSPLWLVILGIFLFGFVAISIFLYGASYKPKPFAWFWKIVPLTLIIYLAISWYWEFILYHEPDDSTSQTAMATFFGLAVLFPAFYLSFKLGYSNLILPEKLRLKFSFKSIAIISAVTILCVATRYLPSPKPKVNIKVNYVAEYNKITKPADYNPNENAALYYEKAFEKLVDMPNNVKAVRKVWPADMNEADFAISKKWIASNSEALGYLKKAAKKPYYWVQRQAKNNFFMGILMPDLGNFRTAVYCTDLQARFMASQGRTEPALQQVIDMYRIGTHLTGPRILIEQLVGIALRAIAVQSGFQILDGAKIQPDLLKDFQEKLQKLSSEEKFVIDFTTEKFMIFDSIQRMFTDDGKGGGHVYGTRLLENSACLEPLLGLELTTEQRESFKRLKRQQTAELTDEMFEYFSRQAHKTPWYLHNEGTDLEKIIEETTKDNPLVQMLTPNAGRVMEISFRVKVHTDALITTLALLRYKADKGRFPENLNQLVTAGYLKGLPLDPFSDNPLVYKRIGDDFTLYSFGADFDDDGGTYSKWGRGEEGGDQVFWPVSRKQN